MKNLISLFLILVASSAFGQKTFRVDGFSEQFFGKVHFDKSSDVFSPGWVGVFNKKTNQQLIKVEAEELTHFGVEGETKANIVQRPYGFQSNIIYDDFNFDGEKDFALMDGQMSCYHGPSFSIYLATNTGFQFSKAFTKLAHDYCGMFGVDSDTKTLSTMTKSGCCWHQYSTYKVKNNKPYPIKIVEEGMSYAAPVWDISVSTRVDGKMKIIQSLQLLDTSAFKKKDNILVFDVNHGKKLNLVQNGQRLLYLFTRGMDTVELYYSKKFQYNKKNQVLRFHRKNVTYKIYQNKIKVLTPEHVYTLPAIKGSVSGSLKTEVLSAMDNVEISDSI